MLFLHRVQEVNIVCFFCRSNIAMLSVYFEELSSLHIEQIKSDSPISLLCKYKVKISSEVKLKWESRCLNTKHTDSKKTETKQNICDFQVTWVVLLVYVLVEVCWLLLRLWIYWSLCTLWKLSQKLHPWIVLKENLENFWIQKNNFRHLLKFLACIGVSTIFIYVLTVNHICSEQKSLSFMSFYFHAKLKLKITSTDQYK